MIAPALLLAAALAQSGADPFASFELRARAVAADDACGLFDDPRHRAAMRASLSRSISEVLALGADPERVEAELARIRTSRETSACASADMEALQWDARQAASRYLRAFRIVAPSPAEGLVWRADRTPRTTGDWLLGQDSAGARLGKAVLADGDRPVFALRASRRPVSVMLVTRDPGLAPEKVDATLDGAFPAPDGLSFTRFAPPDGAQQRFWAVERLDETAARALVRGIDQDGDPQAFALPDGAIEAVSELDPREAVYVEIRFADGPPERVWFQAGGLRAALDFLDLARLPATP